MSPEFFKKSLVNFNYFNVFGTERKDWIIRGVSVKLRKIRF